MIKHVNILLRGKVQGVGFRWATQRQAQKMGVFGFVKNVPNGTLYIEAEGTEDQIAKFVEWARKGPFWAKVEEAEISESSVKDFFRFEIQ